MNISITGFTALQINSPYPFSHSLYLSPTPSLSLSLYLSISFIHKFTLFQVTRCAACSRLLLAVSCSPTRPASSTRVRRSRWTRAPTSPPRRGRTSRAVHSLLLGTSQILCPYYFETTPKERVLEIQKEALFTNLPEYYSFISLEAKLLYNCIGHSLVL